MLTVLAYNVGHSRLLGYGKRPKSNLIKKIESGDRNIYEEYISLIDYTGQSIFCKSKEKTEKPLSKFVGLQMLNTIDVLPPIAFLQPFFISIHSPTDCAQK